jgi:hypothetical protein
MPLAPESGTLARQQAMERFLLQLLTNPGVLHYNGYNATFLYLPLRPPGAFSQMRRALENNLLSEPTVAFCEKSHWFAVGPRSWLRQTIERHVPALAGRRTGEAFSPSPPPEWCRPAPGEFPDELEPLLPVLDWTMGLHTQWRSQAHQRIVHALAAEWLVDDEPPPA